MSARHRPRGRDSIRDPHNLRESFAPLGRLTTRNAVKCRALTACTDGLAETAKKHHQFRRTEGPRRLVRHSRSSYSSRTAKPHRPWDRRVFRMHLP